MSEKETDPKLAMALCRYEIVSRYRAQKPKRGLKKKVLEELASEVWLDPNGEPFTVKPETIRAWERRYRRGGLAGLMDKERPQRGVGTLSEEQCDLICNLKEEVPERSLDRIIKIAEEMGLVEQGVLRRSTVHRVLRNRGLSARKGRVPDKKDLDRFEADFVNDIWQSDMLQGPWLPDPNRPGKMRRAALYAFLDDHSRLLLHGRFSFRENLPYLELVFRRALQRFGVPRRVYYDNGKVYRSQHMKQIVASLDIYRIMHTQPGRPEGHGKIEAFNRLVRSAFLAELKASQITTLDQLNEAWVAWADYDYNRKGHSEIGEAPLDRWRKGEHHVRFAEEEKLRQAFLWKETRTADKAGLFSLLGTRYQVGPKLARHKVEVRFDPEALHEVEVWCRGQFAQRVRPFQVSAHRRPKPAEEQIQVATTPKKPTADYLGHLVAKRRADTRGEPSPQTLAQQAVAAREAQNRALLELLEDRLDPGVVDTAQVRDYLQQFGPFDTECAETTLDDLLTHDQRADQHVTYYLDAIRAAEKGAQP